MSSSSSSNANTNANSNLVATLEHLQGTTFKMTVTNNRETEVSVCTHSSPLEGSLRTRGVVNIVDVKSGEEVPYAGIMAKRAPATADDFIDIAPGASVSVEFDLGRTGEQLRAGRQYRLELRRPHKVLGGKAKDLFGGGRGDPHRFDASVEFTAPGTACVLL